MLHNAARAAQQYQVLRERLQAEEPELDEQTLLDTLEGMTDLHEIAAAVIRAALIDEVFADGLRARIAEMQSRLERLQERARKRRHVVCQAMAGAGLKKIAAPDLTISLRVGTPALVVIDESVIPVPFWESRAPRLNRQALLAELKAGGSIAGVALTNPEPVLSVRTN